MPKHILEHKTKEEIENAVNQANSLFEALVILGYHFSKACNATMTIRNAFRQTCHNLNIDIQKFNRRKRKKCSNCGKPLISSNKTGYCRTCLTNHRVEEWLQTGTLNIKPWSTFPSSCRQYIYNQQNGKCGICGMSDSWNDKPLKFILDHIDGNAANNSRDNLRLICPNCDSQLDTFKSKNKKSARTNRSEYY